MTIERRPVERRTRATRSYPGDAKRISPDENVPPETCWELLGRRGSGHVGVWADGRPDIFSISYVLDRHTLVFRVVPGTKLYSALRSKPIAFSSEGHDADTGLGWTVVVHGTANAGRTIDDFVDNAAFRPLFPWFPGGSDVFVRVTADDITGRVFTTSPLVT